MFLKVQTSNGSNEYVIIDNISEPRFNREPFHIYGYEEYIIFVSADVGYSHICHLFNEPINVGTASNTIEKPDTDSLVSEYFRDGNITLNSLSYFDIQNQDNRKVIFDGEGFLCNNEGKTIHRFPECKRSKKQNDNPGLKSRLY